MEFAITFKGDIDPRRTVALCQQAEQAGFKYAWFFDSHVLWRECYVTMAMCMEHTTSLRFGPCVTNPGVREWSVAASLFATLEIQSGNRFDMGLGRGDSGVHLECADAVDSLLETSGAHAVLDRSTFHSGPLGRLRGRLADRLFPFSVFVGAGDANVRFAGDVIGKLEDPFVFATDAAERHPYDPSPPWKAAGQPPWASMMLFRVAKTAMSWFSPFIPRTPSALRRRRG
ncbi:MAG: LLM class flavin-dependent oxidoreductase [Fimbriimonadaceae bacterium]|nr:LLM class flavin-dependent oxidoreductase [Fimbriimonadaceae bacterium]